MFEQAILRSTVVSEYMISSVSSAYNLACISNGFEAETSNFFFNVKKKNAIDRPTL